jgi:hypothetical protein
LKIATASDIYGVRVFEKEGTSRLQKMQIYKFRFKKKNKNKNPKPES